MTQNYGQAPKWTRESPAPPAVEGEDAPWEGEGEGEGAPGEGAPVPEDEGLDYEGGD
jgi:hypothetical protein